ncbi:MAG TPA: RluA family pseudouridine synthase [Blastocatellia bacterium]|nr:RluA family pseudouridine synthase [Blastocatellia bacterium]
MSERKLQFEAGAERERLDEFIARYVPDLSLTRIRRAVTEGAVLVNDALSKPGARLSSGDRISLVIGADERTSTTPEPIPLEILHEDQDIIVVNKPTALLMHPSRTEKSGTLTNALAYHFQQTSQAGVRPGLIHRLDRNTSGVVVIAKNTRAHRIIAKAFRQRRVEKRYLALVCGRLKNESGEIEAPIDRNPESWPRWGVMESGRPAVTRYVVRQRFREHMLVEAEPLTGRTHQIRIHFTWIGHPLFGDLVYKAAQQEAGEAEIKAETLSLPHHLLHASFLSFRHPEDGREVSFTAPMPLLMRETIEGLAKDG